MTCRWCGKCKRWIWFTKESTVVRCPYCDSDLTVDKPPKEETIKLLKGQEPVKPKVSEWLEDSDPGQEYGTTWACRECMHSIHKPFVWNPYSNGYKHCPHCGARMVVKLDD